MLNKYLYVVITKPKNDIKPEIKNLVEHLKF